ncbi:MAG: T9SS type A sorting domain-containing protein [Hyphomicrobiales bacterium]
MRKFLFTLLGLCLISSVFAKENTPPEFTCDPLTIIGVGQLYSFNVSTKDADGDNVYVYIEEAPSGLEIYDGEEGSFLTGIINSVDKYPVTLVASDGKEETILEFFIQVGIAIGTNNAPEFTCNPSSSAKINKIYNAEITATDADNDKVDVYAYKLPEWLSLTKEEDKYLLSGTPTKVGFYGVHLFATDGTDSTSLYVHIDCRADDTHENIAPVFVSTPKTEADLYKLYEYKAECIDSDNQVAFIHLLEGPEWLSFEDYIGLKDGENPYIKLRGTPEKEGIYKVVLEARDQETATKQEFNITVTNNNDSVNNAPTFKYVPERCGFVGIKYNQNIQCEDVDGDKINIELIEGPEWLDFRAFNEDFYPIHGTADAKIFGTPTEKGIYTVVLKANDGESSTLHEFNIHVVAISEGEKPKIVPITENTNGIVGEYFEYKALCYGNVYEELFVHIPQNLPAGITGNVTIDHENKAKLITLSGIPMESGKFDIKMHCLLAHCELYDDHISIGATLEIKLDIKGDGDDKETQPRIVHMSNGNGKVGEPLEYIIHCYGDDYKTLEVSYDETSLPEGITGEITIDDEKQAKVLTYSGVPENEGKYSILMTCYNSLESGALWVGSTTTLNIEGSSVNKPVIIPITESIGEVGEYFEFKALCKDKNYENLEVTCNSLPSGFNVDITIDAENKAKVVTISGTPNEEGIYQALIIADNKEYAIMHEVEIVITEGDESDNSAPRFICNPITEGSLDVQYLYGITAFDNEHEFIQFKAVQMPKWMSLFTSGVNGHALLAGTPTENGEYPVVISISDGINTIEQTFTVVVMNKGELAQSSSTRNSNIDVYPNPFVNYFKINFADDSASVKIFDINGKMVYNKNNYTSGNRVDISGLNAGIYTVSVSNASLNIVTKIVKQ